MWRGYRSFLQLCLFDSCTVRLISSNRCAPQPPCTPHSLLPLILPPFACGALRRQCNRSRKVSNHSWCTCWKIPWAEKMRIVIFLRNRSAWAFPSSALSLFSCRNTKQKWRARAHGKLRVGLSIFAVKIVAHTWRRRSMGRVAKNVCRIHSLRDINALWCPLILFLW